LRAARHPWHVSLKQPFEVEDANLATLETFFDAFAAGQVNAALAGSGLVYGAGLGRFHKPHFFLGRLDREERRGAAQLLVCGCEYARDVSAIPAASQGGTLIVRREALRQWLWEKAEGWNVRQQDGALKAALLAHGYDRDPAAAIERLVEVETEALAWHEEGEWQAARLLGPEWQAMIAAFKNKRAEIFARAVKDNLADCLVTLPRLATVGSEAMRQFWLASFDGLRRELLIAGADLHRGTADRLRVRLDVAHQRGQPPGQAQQHLQHRLAAEFLAQLVQVGEVHQHHGALAVEPLRALDHAAQAVGEHVVIDQAGERVHLVEVADAAAVVAPLLAAQDEQQEHRRGVVVHHGGGLRPGQFAQQAAHQGDRVRVEVRRRFVKEHDAWPVQEFARNQQFLPHTARIGAHLQVSGLGEFERVEHLRDAGRRTAVKARVERQVLSPGEILVMVVGVGYVAE